MTSRRPTPAGVSTARRLAGAGARVLVDLPSDGEKVAAELGEGAVFARPTSPTRPRSRQPRRDQPGLLVVNCAGIATPGRRRRGVIERVVRSTWSARSTRARLAAARIAAADPVGEERGQPQLPTRVRRRLRRTDRQAAYSASKAGIAGRPCRSPANSPRSYLGRVDWPGIFATPMPGLPGGGRTPSARDGSHTRADWWSEEFAAWSSRS